MSHVLRPRILAILCLLAAAPVIAQDQSAPQKALEAANAIYSKGDYPAAVTAYEKVLTDYPTSPVVGNTQLQLAYAYFATAQYAKSLEMLGKFKSGPTPPKELLEMAALLEPQALSGLASSMKPKRPSGSSGARPSRRSRRGSTAA